MAKTVPQDRLFSTEHEWVKVNGGEAIMGISDHAQHSLGDVVYVELPKVGDSIKKGKAIGVVESVKAVSDIYAPLSGLVKEVNQAVIESPELLNSDPYGQGWLITIQIAEEGESRSLLNPHDYQKLLEQEAK